MQVNWTTLVMMRREAKIRLSKTGEYDIRRQK